jgi:Raf kinase inhibitor-like YbhB/YbcL family protein
MVVAALLALAACGGSGGGGGGSDRPKTSPTKRQAEARVTVTSPAFAEGGAIPQGFTCDGANASPPLRWSGLPAGTREVALVVTDPDAPSGTFTHWTIWGLDPKAGGIPEQTPPATAVQGKNSFNKEGWSGPCPPRGMRAHHYVFTLYALSKPLGSSPGTSVDDVKAALEGKVLAKGTLTGTYERA